MNLIEKWHYFANGKFKVHHKFEGRKLIAELDEHTLNSVNRGFYDTPKLVARPMSNLTTEEILQLEVFPELTNDLTEDERIEDIQVMRNVYIKRIEEMVWKSTLLFMKLIEFGVYPFNQEDFENKKVIARYK